MSTACVRCGFPNAETALHCRACSAPLQSGGPEAAINTKLQKILAETRARTRARQRRGVAMDPNRVDVVPRLPGGLASSDETLKKSLDKARQARREVLRDELRRGPRGGEIQAPVSRSVPPRAELATEQPRTVVDRVPPALHRTMEEASEPTVIEPVAPPAAAVAEEVAEPTVIEPVARPAAAVAEEAAESTVIDRAAPPVAAVVEEYAEPPVHEQAAASSMRPAVNEPPMRPEPATEASAKRPKQQMPGRRHGAEEAEPWPRSRGRRSEPSVPDRGRPAARPRRAKREGPSVGRRAAKATAATVGLTVGKLRQAAKTMRARAATKAEQVDEVRPDTGPVEVVDEAAIGLFGLRRLAATTVDATPALVTAGLFLRSRLAGGGQPPEEVIASWMLGEASVGLGLMLPIVAWALWCYAGITIWRATPGMKLLGLRWQDDAAWRPFARPVLALIGLLPLGLGGTYALVDRNSRSLADLLLGLRWRRT